MVFSDDCVGQGVYNHYSTIANKKIPRNLSEGNFYTNCTFFHAVKPVSV